jgi:long-chain acyl-CoA synthetase
MKRRVIPLALALCLSLPALAAEVGGAKLDDKLSLGGQELVLNGAGIRTRLMFKVYVASLYLPQKAVDPAAVLTQAPRRIQLNVLRHLTADQLVDALVEGLQANNTADEVAAVKAQTDQLVATMKAFNEVREKDVVGLDFVNGDTKISLNGQAKGSIAGERFNQALTRVWLGDKPVQADLKKALLGG